MEEDKKKKKNKKKKNKQSTKPTEIATTESTSLGQTHLLDIQENTNGQLSGDINSSTLDVNRGRNHANGTERKNVAEVEKQHRLDGEINLQEKVRQLEAEKDAHIQKEGFLDKTKHLRTENAQKEDTERERVGLLQDEKNASIQKENLLEDRIKQLLKEKDENAQREASEREQIKTIYDEKNAFVQNEVSLKVKLVQLEKENNAVRLNEGILEQKILQLQKEIEAHLQKEVNLEAKILHLEGEKGSWVQKEVIFENKINQLVDEAAFLNLTGASLQERIEHMEKERDSWNLKEISTKDSVSFLSNENTKLRAQVIDLEQSRERFLLEKEHLTQALSGLQLQLHNLETAAGTCHSSVDNKVISEYGDANYQIEPERALVEKLVAANSELVEKVNELYAELDRRGVRTEEYSSVPGDVTTNQSISDNSALVPDLTIGVNGGHNIGQVTNSISELPISGSAHFPEDVIVEDQTNSSELMKINDVGGLAKSLEITEVDDEIVQIPLDEGEIKENNTVLPPQNGGDDDVFITDAPLIGAPFRLISFVARYVSGADLVSKNSG